MTYKAHIKFKSNLNVSYKNIQKYCTVLRVSPTEAELKICLDAGADPRGWGGVSPGPGPPPPYF